VEERVDIAVRISRAIDPALSRDWSVLGRVSNVFDRDYETVAWYNQPGREYRLSVRYQPK